MGKKKTCFGNREIDDAIIGGICNNLLFIPFSTVMSEAHVQTHGKVFLSPSDLTSHLMDRENLKSCKQELQPVVLQEAGLISRRIKSSAGEIT